MSGRKIRCVLLAKIIIVAHFGSKCAAMGIAARFEYLDNVVNHCRPTRGPRLIPRAHLAAHSCRITRERKLREGALLRERFSAGRNGRRSYASVIPDRGNRTLLAQAADDAAAQIDTGSFDRTVRNER